MYAAGAHDCMDAGGRATPGAVAEDARSGDLAINEEHDDG